VGEGLATRARTRRRAGGAAGRGATSCQFNLHSGGLFRPFICCTLEPILGRDQSAARRGRRVRPPRAHPGVEPHWRVRRRAGGGRPARPRAAGGSQGGRHPHRPADAGDGRPHAARGTAGARGAHARRRDDGAEDHARAGRAAAPLRHRGDVHEADRAGRARRRAAALALAHHRGTHHRDHAVRLPAAARGRAQDRADRGALRPGRGSALLRPRRPGARRDAAARGAGSRERDRRLARSAASAPRAIARSASRCSTS